MSPLLAYVDAISVVVAVISVVVAVIAIVVACYQFSAQKKLEQRIAMGQFILQFDEMLAQFEDIDLIVKIGPTGSRTPRVLTDKEWFRAQRYLSRLESLNVYIRDGIIDKDVADYSYSHRIVALITHPQLKSKAEEDIPSNRDLRSLLNNLEKGKVFQQWLKYYE